MRTVRLGASLRVDISCMNSSILKILGASEGTFNWAVSESLKKTPALLLGNTIVSSSILEWLLMISVTVSSKNVFTLKFRQNELKWFTLDLKLLQKKTLH